jgi:hypothetical protein
MFGVEDYLLLSAQIVPQMFQAKLYIGANVSAVQRVKEVPEVACETKLRSSAEVLDVLRTVVDASQFLFVQKVKRH